MRNPLERGLATGRINAIDPITAGLAIGGAVLGGSGGSSGSNTTVTDVPAWMRPFLTGGQGVLTQAQNLFNQGPKEFFPGDTVADLTDPQLTGIDFISGAAENAALPGQAQDLASRTLSGEFLGKAPFMEAFGDDILDSVTSRFGASGRSGSALEADAATKELGAVASRLFEGERDNMMQTLGLSPQIQDLQFSPGREMLNIGTLLQGQNQAEIDADFDRFMFEQDAPRQNLQDFASIVFGAPSGSVTSTNTNRNPALGALGGAASALGLGGQFGLIGG